MSIPNMRKYLRRPITDSPPNETTTGTREGLRAGVNSQPSRSPSPVSSIMAMSAFEVGLLSSASSIRQAHQIPPVPQTTQQRDYGEEMASIFNGFTAHSLSSNPSTRAQSIRTVSSRTTAASTRRRLSPPLPTTQRPSQEHVAELSVRYNSQQSAARSTPTTQLISLASTGSSTPAISPGAKTARTNSIRANSLRHGRSGLESPLVSAPVPSNTAHESPPVSLLRERPNALTPQIMATQAPSTRSQQGAGAISSIRISAIPIRASPHRNQTVSGTSRTPSSASPRSRSRNSSQRASSAQSSASSVYHSALSTPLPFRTTHLQNTVARPNNPNNPFPRLMSSTHPPVPSTRLPNSSGQSTASSIRPVVPSVRPTVPSVYSAAPTIRPPLPSLRPTVSLIRSSGSSSSSRSASVTHSPTPSMHTAVSTVRPPLPSVRPATQPIHTVAPSMHTATSIRPPLPSLHPIPLSIRPSLPSLHSAPPSIHPIASIAPIPVPTAPSVVLPPPSVHSVAPLTRPATHTPAAVNVPAATPSTSDPPPPSQDSSPSPPVDNLTPPIISYHSTPEEDSEPPPPVDVHTPTGGSSSSPGAAISSSGNGFHLPAVAVSAAWLVAANNLALAVLVAIFTNDCLFDKVYDAQIARHVFALPWLVLLAYCLRPGNKIENYFRLPESPTVTSVLIGIVYVMVMMCFFSDSILDVLQKGGAGIDYASVGESCRPPFVRPRVLFLIFLILNSLTGATGIMWLLVSFGWVGD